MTPSQPHTGADSAEQLSGGTDQVPPASESCSPSAGPRAGRAHRRGKAARHGSRTPSAHHAESEPGTSGNCGRVGGCSSRRVRWPDSRIGLRPCDANPRLSHAVQVPGGNSCALVSARSASVDCSESAVRSGLPQPGVATRFASRPSPVRADGKGGRCVHGDAPSFEKARGIGSPIRLLTMLPGSAWFGRPQIESPAGVALLPERRRRVRSRLRRVVRTSQVGRLALPPAQYFSEIPRNCSAGGRSAAGDV